jgi:hypothetical protein
MASEPDIAVSADAAAQASLNILITRSLLLPLINSQADADSAFVVARGRAFNLVQSVSARLSDLASLFANLLEMPSRPVTETWEPGINLAAAPVPTLRRKRRDSVWLSCATRYAAMACRKIMNARHDA